MWDRCEVSAMYYQGVNEYVEHAQELVEQFPQMDEATTKAAVMRDFLDLLEWQIPTNTQLDYSVDAIGESSTIDYALVLDGNPAAFIEVKGVDTSLTVDHEVRLLSTMINQKVDYGILTNGEQYSFFQRQATASNMNVKKIAEVDVRELSDRKSVLEAYSSDAIESGESGAILDRMDEEIEAGRELDIKEDLATELRDLLSTRYPDTRVE